MVKLTEAQKKKRNETREKNKKIKEENRQIEMFENNKIKMIKEYRLYQEMTPSRVFSKGEKVESLSARWTNIVIAEVLEEGAAYIIKYNTIDNNYGKPVTNEVTNIVHWSELKKQNSGFKDNLHKRNILRNIQFFNMHISSLIHKHNHFGVDMSPDYQRDDVWTEADKINLIDSIINSRDIGKFVFIFLDYKEDSPSYEILDGKQRLQAIIDFTNDKFKYKGRYYSELTSSDIRHFGDVMVSVGESRSELSKKEKYEYFLSLNISGIPQSEDHINFVKGLLDEV